MKIAILGYGKMGKIIEQVAIDRGHSIVLTIGAENQQDFTKENIKKVDVAIEFSTPHTALHNYVRCFENDIPVVSGTTGWLKDKDKVVAYCNSGFRFFYASNFSLGVNLFFRLNRCLADLMAPFNNYSTSVEEIHHVHKLDAPSGTAITIAEGIIENIPLLKKWGNTVTNQKNILPIESKREGEVPGTHIVRYTSAQDLLEIKHEAKGREGFALGAVLAAEFLVKKKGGWYSMEDLLQL